jgi:hypothetical protein
VTYLTKLVLIAGTATIMTRSVGKGVAILTMDDAFLQNRDKLNKHPNSAMGFVLRPLQDIGNGFYCGVVGVVRVPYVGAKRNGVVGFVSGLGKGIAGVATKPVVGILDSVTHIGEGFRYAVKSIQTKRGSLAERQRYCSLFGPDGRLLPYSYSAAYGSHVLRLLENVHRTRIQLPFNRGSLLGMKHGRNSLVFNDGEGESGAQRRSSLWKTFTRTGPDDRTHMSESAAGSNFTLARARRRSISDPGTDFHRIESVIYASVFSTDVGSDLVVIVTSLRVVVAAHCRDKGDSYVGITWECRTKDMAPPEILPNEDHNGEEVLRLSKRFAVTPRPLDVHNSDESVVVRTADTKTLHLLYNCLNIILGSYANIEDSSFDTWYEDERNVIHVGSWQFQRRSTVGTHVESQKLYFDDLETVEWKVIVSDSNQKALPTWLAQDKMLAIKAHAQIPQLIASSLPSIQDNDTMRVCKSHLQEGRMTAEEFSVFMEKEKLYGHNMHQSSQDYHQLDIPELGGQLAGSGGVKRSSSAMKKLRNTVRRTISLFTPSSDSIYHGASEDGKSEGPAYQPSANDEPIGVTDDVSATKKQGEGGGGEGDRNPARFKFGKRTTRDSSLASSLSEVSAEEDLGHVISSSSSAKEERVSGLSSEQVEPGTTKTFPFRVQQRERIATSLTRVPHAAASANTGASCPSISETANVESPYIDARQPVSPAVRLQDDTSRHSREPKIGVIGIMTTSADVLGPYSNTRY